MLRLNPGVYITIFSMIVLSYTAESISDVSVVKTGTTIVSHHEGKKIRGIENAMRQNRLSSKEAEFYHQEDM